MSEILLPLGSFVIFAISVSVGYGMRKHHWWKPVTVIACIALLLGYLRYAAQGTGWEGIGLVIIAIFAVLPAGIGLICGVGYGWYKNTRSPDDGPSGSDPKF
ncbi:hypothetical protein [Celeribacter sp.]|uniref:hypothetical protein n=1 Tax=Celeribacter sp. TaxID=1890673 RepID=UPI003A901B9F